MELTSRTRSFRRHDAPPAPAPAAAPPAAFAHRPRAGLFSQPPKHGSWKSTSLKGSYDCACGTCHSEMTTAAILLHEVTEDGRLGRLIGPCNPRCAPTAIVRHANKRIALVHAQYAQVGADATIAAEQSNALLFHDRSGPFANLASPA